MRDSSDTVLSPYEPLDKENPRIRPTLVNTRPLHIESQLAFPAWFAPPEELARFSVSWNACSTTIENAASARSICRLSSLPGVGERGGGAGRGMRALSVCGAPG